MGDASARFRAAYGAPAWHLAVLVAAFALTGWVALRIVGEATAGRMLLWFVGAVIAHDLVLFPVYALADTALAATLRAPTLRAPTDPAARPRYGARARLAAINHIRVPALASGLLFLVYLPGILRLDADTHLAATGQTQQPYLGRWVLITVAMVTASGLWYAARRPWRRAGARTR